ncbi:hypothetical protein Pint_21371 [Pistacia integerrima]|uniref:Uncharacterized protein n=1 Tax=Pistacia integerrima TaxID=434235 RepID=A0ACC0XDD2_9ROSI|nr:hypothetical protein Pint_21371 [Pistacia integerrima]
MKPYSFYFPYIFVFLCLLYQPSNCQQPYQKNLLDCSQNLSTTASYSCNISETSCQSFVTFRSRPPYDSPISIARLLTSDASGIAFINNISPTSHIPSGKLIIVPLSCSCPRGFYQHNTVYTIQDGSETAFTIVNDTYQGLTSCQALNGEFFDQNVFVGYEVVVQLKCACPSTNQTANGVISLLQYLITRGDTVESIANVFGVDKESIFEANMISQDNIFFAFTSLFIPLKNDSCLINPQNFFCYNCPADFPRDARLQASTCDHGKKFPVKIVTLLAKENQLLEILDTRVAKEAREEDIQSIAELVMRCLRLNGKKRPTMKEVATELEGLIKSQRSLEIDQDQEPRKGAERCCIWKLLRKPNRDQLKTAQNFPYNWMSPNRFRSQLSANHFFYFIFLLILYVVKLIFMEWLLKLVTL